MLLFLILLLFSSSTYSMMFGLGSRAQDAVIQCYWRDLELYNDFIPGYPCLGLIVEHPGFTELMKQIADQDALWIRQDCVLSLLLNVIEDRGFCFLDKSRIPQLLGIFLSAAKQKGHIHFVDSVLHPHNPRCLLSVAIQKNNPECAKKALEYGASLEAPCYSQKDSQFYYPLKFACKEFGPESPMVESLCAHGAPLLAQDKHLLGPLNRLA